MFIIIHSQCNTSLTQDFAATDLITSIVAYEIPKKQCKFTWKCFKNLVSSERLRLIYCIYCKCTATRTETLPENATLDNFDSYYIIFKCQYFVENESVASKFGGQILQLIYFSFGVYEIWLFGNGATKKTRRYLPLSNKWLIRALWQISILVSRPLITDHWSFGPLLYIPEQELPKQLAEIERWCILELRAAVLQSRHKELPVLNNVSYGSTVSREGNGRILTSLSSPSHRLVKAHRKITVIN